MQLKKDFLQIKPQLENPGAFETVGLSNISNNYNGATSNSIEINLVNGKELPADAEGLRFLAKTKAAILAAELINKKDYQKITVNIKTESKSGIITRTSKETFSFSFEELEEEAPPLDSIQNDTIIVNSADLN